MTISYFDNKEQEPQITELYEVLGDASTLWQQIDEELFKIAAEMTGYWKFPTKKAGWTWINSLKKRVLLYRQPCQNSFRATIVLGEAAVQSFLNSDGPDILKDKVRETRVYAEGRSILFEISSNQDLQELLILLPYKLN
ncbi:DUF3788 family protein [Enterococcus sp. LJL128]|uniref:DUF3788 family protein n=1 Tax=Enterococcus sp. LJL51 TaxID=3416656 RepID=UPI003CF27BE7